MSYFEVSRALIVAAALSFLPCGLVAQQAAASSRVKRMRRRHRRVRRP